MLSILWLEAKRGPKNGLCSEFKRTSELIKPPIQTQIVTNRPKITGLILMAIQLNLQQRDNCQVPKSGRCQSSLLTQIQWSRFFHATGWRYRSNCPICSRRAIHFRLIVVSRRKRRASATLPGSPLRRNGSVPHNRIFWLSSCIAQKARPKTGASQV